MMRTALTIGVALLLSGAASAQNDAVDTVTTPGSGRLITCRSWVLYNSCTTHKVVLPERVAVGDHIELRYGSNPKNYIFHVTRIQLDGGEACRVLSTSSGSDDDREKIEIAHCRPLGR